MGRAIDAIDQLLAAPSPTTTDCMLSALPVSELVDDMQERPCAEDSLPRLPPTAQASVFRCRHQEFGALCGSRGVQPADPTADRSLR